MGFESYLNADARLVLLRTLAQDSDYRLNDRLLAVAARGLGHDLSFDRLRVQLSWLAEQELLTLETGAGGVQIATLTERGLDVAAGRARVPGVARPEPGAEAL